ncbi:MAG: hypothetical protein ACR2OJ_16195 [Hyphomicrobiales bacterium]
MGFWDVDGIFGATTVGLWDANGVKIGEVNSGTSAVNTVSTAGGHGNWYFMDFDVVLNPGNYVVGSHGASGMDYTFGTGTLSTSLVTYVDDRYAGGGIFQYPNRSVNWNFGRGFLGGNIAFIPIPTPLILFLTGLIGLGIIGRRKYS